MKTPTDRFVDLGDIFYPGLDSVLFVASSALKTCEQLFETAVRANKALVFDFTERDIKFMTKLFPSIKTDTELVRAFLGMMILTRLQMPYDILRVLHTAGTEHYTCRVIPGIPPID